MKVSQLNPLEETALRIHIFWDIYTFLGWVNITGGLNDYKTLISRVKTFSPLEENSKISRKVGDCLPIDTAYYSQNLKIKHRHCENFKSRSVKFYCLLIQTT
jgi:hypothetical protein